MGPIIMVKVLKTQAIHIAEAPSPHKPPPKKKC